MRKIKKSFGSLIASLLLLLFAVALVPIDIYHNHTLKSNCTENYRVDKCSHKVHFAEKSHPCWVCAVHYSKAFVKPALPEIAVPVTGSIHLVALVLAGAFVTLRSTNLRGPPSLIF